MLHCESRDDPNAFESILTFAHHGTGTRIEMRTVFPTKELRDAAVEKYHAMEGGQRTQAGQAYEHPGRTYSQTLVVTQYARSRDDPRTGRCPKLA
mgnify:FL=1